MNAPITSQPDTPPEEPAIDAIIFGPGVLYPRTNGGMGGATEGLRAGLFLFIATARSRGTRLGLVENRPPELIEETLNDSGLLDPGDFDDICRQPSLGAPERLVAMIERLGVRAERSVALVVDRYGAVSAQRAGLATAAIIEPDDEPLLHSDLSLTMGDLKLERLEALVRTS